MSAQKQIKLYCRLCMLNVLAEVKLCPSIDCPIYQFRLGGTIKGVSKQQSVKLKCQDCTQSNKTSTCKEKNCPLWMYRTGKRPTTTLNKDKPKRTMSEEHKAKLKAGKEAKKNNDNI